jgi:hypothetical protein
MECFLSFVEARGKQTKKPQKAKVMKAKEGLTARKENREEKRGEEKRG